MTDVLVCLQICFKHHADVHGVLSGGRDVDWCLDSASQFQLIRLYGHNANEWHLNDELLRILVVKAVLFDAPLGTLKE